MLNCCCEIHFKEGAFLWLTVLIVHLLTPTIKVAGVTQTTKKLPLPTGARSVIAVVLMRNSIRTKYVLLATHSILIPGVGIAITTDAQPIVIVTVATIPNSLPLTSLLEANNLIKGVLQYENTNYA